MLLSISFEFKFKKIIDHHFSKQIIKDIIIECLRRTYVSRRPKDEIILRTYLETQYTSKDFKGLTSELNIVQSFSCKGCSHNNDCIESFRVTLKKEDVYQTTYVIFEQSRITLFQYI